MNGYRSAPRRRGDELVAAIFSATLTELENNGFAALSMEGVAARARVGKASLYRRWGSKLELVVNAVSTTFPDSDQLADTGSLRGDLVDNFTQVANVLAGPTGHAIRGFVGEALRDRSGSIDLRARSHGRGARAMRVLVARAVDRGELGAIELTDQQAAVGHTLVRHQFLWQGEVTDTAIAAIVDEVVVPLLLSASGRPSPSA